jgi:DNA transposition AAA+ family ATPase
MEIKADIKTLLDESGLNLSSLARMACVNQSILSRFINGDQAGLNSKTLEKLWPFVYGEKRPPALPKEDQAA